MRFPHYHDEVASALEAIGDPRYGAAVAADRGSKLTHLGISFPDLRRRVKQGFSFYALPEPDVLDVWDDLWRASPYGDVLFAAIEYYAPRLRQAPVVPGLWPVMRGWSDRVDNWCHADGLAGLYSRLLEANEREVYPTMLQWNADESEWLRRLSLVSLIHYSGKNAVFLPPERVLPLVTNCLDDRRHYVQTAAGWVLREMWRVHPAEIRSYVEANAKSLSAEALSRAIERQPPPEREELRRLRRSATG
jgi:3-methyladenine DNA glycosylase AlkD